MRVIRTCEVLDELVAEDGAVVLVEAATGDRVVRISVFGQLIRELAAEGITIDCLVQELEARLGPSTEGDAGLLVARAVDALERDGLVSSSPRTATPACNDLGDKS
jgi:hypothetical protein